MPTPRAASALGSTCTRTAYFCCPCTWTCATPEIVEMRCARKVSAYSLTVESGRVSEVSVRKKIGESAGFTFRNEGGVDMVGGSCLVEAGDRRELLLERCRHRGGHGLRACTRELGRDLYRGEIDVGQRRDR